MNSWIDPHRIVSAEPLPRDHVVVTFVEGKRVSIHPVGEYERVREAAVILAKQAKRPVKVLPMTIIELMGFMGMDPAEFAASLSPKDAEQDRQLVVATCMEILRECNDAAVRKEAYDLLTSIGEIQQ